ncbi:AGC family protein kinase [Trichomonas vaginalis G3]|uniref:AGC family protein kinase n=1 Tax=Trichomonas vaginalis (strain ATCC PRA-98 / G3) TaxID=412133 RepID=A2DJ83_TRIV3|nr:protein serine/threonine kinase protein [Trichomonas vaginalis G3]EAY19470.1 AGC family protein kinase [Trichomonas vaginalis G3]KAI5520051.1 protein serine/threonine kinase protein [Trichomonas vaginalis G3]|eukprot:XP_001580456.1 AGC family protein kinase [Trichomonas vaginalis G3]
MQVNDYLGLFETLELYDASAFSRTFNAVEAESDRQVSILIYYKNFPREQIVSIQPPDIDFIGLTTVYDITEDQDFIVVPQQIVPAGDLITNLLPNPILSERYISTIAFCLLHTLRVLHSNNIIVRNLSVYNIMLSNEQSCPFKIKNFYLAKILDVQIQSHILEYDDFPAPEVLESKPYGPPSDIWSLGCILYLLLRGLPPYPFTKKNDATYIKEHPIVFDDDVWSTISEDAREIVQGMLQLDPQRRSTVDDLLETAWINGNCSESIIEDAQSDLQASLMTIRLQRSIAAASSIEVFKSFNRQKVLYNSNEGKK